MKLKEKLLLFAVIIFGLIFRLYGINFDRVCCQHPDERAIVMFALPLSFPNSFEQFLSPQSPLNPNFFAYGNLPLYLLKISSQLVGLINSEFTEYDKINLVGRSISIVAELITLFLIFLIAKNLKNTKTGIIASFLYAISVLPIQYSHFFTSDILLTMFITLTLFRAIKFYQHPSFINAVFLGVSFGLSLATKISAIPVVASVLFVLVSEFLFIFIKTPHKYKNWFPHVPAFLKKLFKEGLLIAICAIITFIVSQPYALIDFKNFWLQNLQQSHMTRDPYTFPYTLQYVGKIPYVHEFINIFYYGLGPALTLLTFTGIIFIFINFKKEPQEKKSEYLIIIIFFVTFFAIVGNFSIGFMRYLLPIYPIMAIFAAIALRKMLTSIKANSSINLYRLSKFVILIFLLYWPLSFISIYSKANTRLDASNWIRSNIPKGSSLAVEHWDDRLPMHDSTGYIFQELALYEQPDDQIKWSKINEQLENSDYIIIASNRLYVPLQKLSDCQKYLKCYPIAAKYYEDLFSNKLNFELIKEFSSYPTIPFLGYQIKDDSADESFTVYDHPKILIFKKGE